MVGGRPSGRPSFFGPPMILPLEAVTTLIRDAAQRFALPLFAAPTGVREKAPGDVVTAADEAIEQFLSDQLVRLLPGSAVVGEELAAKDPEWAGALAGEAPVWIIDPIDGTMNFSRGIPLFTIMVALATRGETVGAWIYDPIHDLFGVAEKGAGTTINGRPARASKRNNLKSMSGGFHLKFAAPAMAASLAARAAEVGTVFEPRGAGQEYLYLADGRIDFTFFHRLLPWDHAPGLLLHEEAGGYAARLTDGSRYRVDDDPWRGPLLAAPDRDTWRVLRDTLLR